MEWLIHYQIYGSIACESQMIAAVWQVRMRHAIDCMHIGV